MNPIELFEHLAELFFDGDWYPNFVACLIYSSISAAILFAVVAVLRRGLGNRLAPEYWHLLWLVVAVRLFLPFAPTSALSLHWIWQPRTIQEVQRTPDGSTKVVSSTSHPAPIVEWAGNKHELRTSTPYGPEELTPTSRTNASANQESFLASVSLHFFWLIFCLLLLFWPLGTLVVLAREIWTTALFRGRLYGNTPVTDPRLLRLVDECREMISTRRKVSLFIVRGLSSPAQIGLKSPAILLPEDVTQDFPDDSLRQIILHELAHIKRKDAWWNLFLFVLQTLYWWNPLYWMLRTRILTERELACDALVLRKLGNEQATNYGETLLRIVERLNRSGESFPPPMTASSFPGLGRNATSLKHRLNSLQHPERGTSRIAHVAAIALVGFLILSGWTDAAPELRELPILQITVPDDAVWIPTDNVAMPAESTESFVYRGGELLDHYLRVNPLPNDESDPMKSAQTRKSAKDWVIQQCHLLVPGIVEKDALRWKEDDLQLSVTRPQWEQIQQLLDQLLLFSFEQVHTEIRLISTPHDLLQQEKIRGGTVVSGSFSKQKDSAVASLLDRSSQSSVYLVQLDDSVANRLITSCQQDERSNLIFSPKTTSYSYSPLKQPATRVFRSILPIPCNDHLSRAGKESSLTESPTLICFTKESMLE